MPEQDAATSDNANHVKLSEEWVHSIVRKSSFGDMGVIDELAFIQRSYPEYFNKMLQVAISTAAMYAQDRLLEHFMPMAQDLHGSQFVELVIEAAASADQKAILSKWLKSIEREKSLAAIGISGADEYNDALCQAARKGDVRGILNLIDSSDFLKNPANHSRMAEALKIAAACGHTDATKALAEKCPATVVTKDALKAAMQMGHNEAADIIVALNKGVIGIKHLSRRVDADLSLDDGLKQAASMGGTMNSAYLKFLEEFAVTASIRGDLYGVQDALNRINQAHYDRILHGQPVIEQLKDTAEYGHVLQACMGEAAKQGHTHIVKSLIDSDWFGKSVFDLLLAAEVHGQKNVIRTLIPYCKNDPYMAMLDHRIAAGSQAMDKGPTEVMIAVANLIDSGSITEVEQQLDNILQKSPDAYKKVGAVDWLYTCAAISGRTDVINVLRQRGLDCSSKGVVIYTAAKHSHDDVAGHICDVCACHPDLAGQAERKKKHADAEIAPNHRETLAQEQNQVAEDHREKRAVVAEAETPIADVTPTPKPATVEISPIKRQEALDYSKWLAAMAPAGDVLRAIQKRSGDNLDLRDAMMSAAVSEAAYYGKTKTVGLLMEQQWSGKDNPAFILDASLTGQTNVINVLSHYVHPVEKADTLLAKYGTPRAPLLTAIIDNDRDAFRVGLDQVPLNSSVMKDAMDIASALGRMEMISIVLEMSFDTQNLSSAIYKAAQGGHLELATFLSMQNKGVAMHKEFISEVKPVQKEVQTQIMTRNALNRWCEAAGFDKMIHMLEKEYFRGEDGLKKSGAEYSTKARARNVRYTFGKDNIPCEVDYEKQTLRRLDGLTFSYGGSVLRTGVGIFGEVLKESGLSMNDAERILSQIANLDTPEKVHRMEIARQPEINDQNRHVYSDRLTKRIALLEKQKSGPVPTIDSESPSF